MWNDISVKRLIKAKTSHFETQIEAANSLFDWAMNFVEQLRKENEQLRKQLAEREAEDARSVQDNGSSVTVD